MKVFVKSFALIMFSLQLCFVCLSTRVFANNVITPAKPLRILAYGDSLTAGYRLPPKDSYPSQLSTLLNQSGFSVEIINGGVSGDTSAQALSRLNWSLKKGPFEIVLLCIGANDGLRQLSVAALQENLTKMIESFRNQNIQVVLIGMELPTNFSAGYRASFKKAYSDVAKKFGLKFYPFLLKDVTQVNKLNLNDTIHPNKEGYAIIAKNLKDFLVKHILTK